MAAPLSQRYRSLFVIGRGGMGSVEAALELGDPSAPREGAEAAHPSSYQRIVALKRLLPDAAQDARRTEMFLREAKLAAMLRHPNVIRAYDYGEIEGELYLAMEYVEGQPLSRVLGALAKENTTLEPSLAAHVLAEVCEGLHAAHELADEKGQPLQLVHRDVSPQNVMLAFDGHVRLLDFGVAKIEAESVTKTGEVKGKTAYMSPEQAMGDAIDRRSDLFGVGAVLFECLTSRRMWGDGTDMDVIRKLALESPPDLAAHAKDAPAEMCALYTKLVARDAKDRPATARDVAETLRALVPQGSEAAARAIRDILETHFGAQAEKQRARLLWSLDNVAPDQAQELRESVLPSLSQVSIHEPIMQARSTAPRDHRKRAPWWLVSAIALGAAVVGWRVLAAPAPPKPSPPPSEPQPTSAVATVTTAASSTSITTATASAIPSPPPSVTAAPSPPRSGKPATSASARPPVTAAPPTSAKPPPDVDLHPF